MPYHHSMLLNRILNVLSFVITVVSAWDPSDRDCTYSSLCFTSFYWCDPTGKSCSYPDNVYPQRQPRPNESRFGFPTLIWNHNYQLTWRTEVDDYPVTVWWWMMDANMTGLGERRPGVPDYVVWESSESTLHTQTDRQSEVSTHQIDGYDAETAIDVTDATSLTFAPSSDLFPNPLAPTLNFTQAIGLATGQTFISISQYGSDRANSTDLSREMGRTDSLGDNTQTFYVAPEWAEAAIDLARSEEKEKWQRKLALGVGLGVGLSVLVTYLFTWAAAQWWARRGTRKYGGEKGLGARRWWIGF
ncbi:hypothetical protein PMIN02_008484 [Paraphaeosphaeria minitans]